MTIDMLAKTILSATKKGFFRPKPIFEAYAALSPDELIAVERDAGVTLPDELRRWLLTVGYGDVAEELSFRKEWLTSIRTGQLKGSIIFAQDIRGNFYAVDSLHGHIYYLSRSEPAFARLAESFLTFMEELIRREYKLIAWTDAIESHKYDW
jgi:hypothetical protein